MSLVLQVFWDSNASVVKNAVFPGGCSLSAQNYSSLADVQKFITPKMFIVSRRANNRWKDQKVLNNSYNWLQVIFPSEQSRLCIFWLLLAVKSDLTAVQRFSFWRLLSGFEDSHIPWCSSSMVWCSSYIRSGFLHEMWSIHLPKSVTSVPLQQPCVRVYLIFSIPMLKSLYTIESLTNVLITATFMAESFLRKSECEFLALPCGIVLIVIPKNPTLMPLVLNLGFLSPWTSPSEVASGIAHSCLTY
jgi:hypothetical protein